MEELPKEQSEYLKKLRKHDRDLNYFKNRFADMSFDSVCDETQIINSLEKHGMISASNTRARKQVVDGGSITDANGVVLSTPTLTREIGFRPHKRWQELP